jgi:hypothetical protein
MYQLEGNPAPETTKPPEDLQGSEDGEGYTGPDYIPAPSPPGSTHTLSPENTSDGRPSKRTRVEVEEVEDEDAPGRRYVQSYPEGAAYILGQGKTMFETYREKQDGRKEQRWAPFQDKEEWELAQWLMKNVGQMKIDEFLKLDIVRFKDPQRTCETKQLTD